MGMMADIENSRRGFIFVMLSIIQGLLITNPKEIEAAKNNAKKIIGQIEMEGLWSSRPKREAMVSSVVMAKKTTLYRNNGDKYISVCNINQTGKMVWELCDGKHSTKDICRSIVQSCQVSEETVRNDVFFFLSELKKIGAIRL
jgi:hypothetical protein